ncbi:putative transporter small subunit, partial [Glutamicibacter protophormiae]
MLALSLYVLIWPVIVAVVAVVICKGFMSEVREAKRRGED